MSRANQWWLCEQVCGGYNDRASRTSWPVPRRRGGRCHPAPCPLHSPQAAVPCQAPGRLPLCVTLCTIPSTQALIPPPAPGRADGNESSSGSSSFFLVPFPGHGEGCTYVIQAQYIRAYRKFLWCLGERTVTYSGCNELSWGVAKSLQAVAAMHRCKMQTEAAGTAFIQPLAWPS